MKYTPAKMIYITMNAKKVGRLALIERSIYFEYDPTFLQTGIQLSPFKLPLKPGAVACDDNMFDGIYGVFNDSLPDGWGRLLLDRQVRSHGISPEQLTSLDRLSHVGQHGMGALCYEPDIGSSHSGETSLNLDTLAQETVQVMEGNAEEVFTDLLELSGSSAGARPKIMVGVDSTLKNIIHGQHHLPEKYSPWMIKFASSHDRKDIGAIEYAYSLMAKAAGLVMPQTYLFPAKKGGGYFGVKRFDRNQGERLHMHSLCGLLHTDHRMPSLDYETVLRATLNLTKNMSEVIKMFRLATFNVLAHNRDDHSKNFSFLMKTDGTWIASPAYDLTFSNGPAGEQSTTVLGEGKVPGKKQLLALAEKFDIKKSQDIFDEVSTAIVRWPEFAAEAGVSIASQQHIGRVILPTGSYTPPQ